MCILENVLHRPDQFWVDVIKLATQFFLKNVIENFSKKLKSDWMSRSFA